MVTTTYPNDDYLAPDVLGVAMERFARPNLLAWNLCKHVDMGDANSIQYVQESTSPLDDPMKPSALPEITPGSRFPEVKMKKFEVKSGVGKMYGLQMRFDRTVRRNKTMVNMINESVETGALWLAQLFNTLVFNNMTNNWSTTTATETNDEPYNKTVTHAWSDTTNRVPIENINDIKLLVEDTEGWANELEESYLQKTEFFQLSDYLQTTTNVPWAKDPTTGQWNRMVEGIMMNDVHKLAGIPANTALFLSRNKKPTTIYFKTDMAMEDAPGEFATVPITTMDGKTLPGNWHIYQFFDNHTHDNVVQIWTEAFPVTTRGGRKSVGILAGL